MSIDKAGYCASDYTRFIRDSYAARMYHSILCAMKMVEIEEEYLSKFDDDLREELINLIPFNSNVLEYNMGLGDDLEIDRYPLIQHEYKEMIPILIEVLSTLGVDKDGEKKRVTNVILKNIFNDIKLRARNNVICISKLVNEYETHASNENPDRDLVNHICASFNVGIQYYNLFAIALSKLLVVIHTRFPSDDKFREFADLIEALNTATKICVVTTKTCNLFTPLDTDYTILYVNNKLYDLSKNPSLRDLIINHFGNPYCCFITQDEYLRRFPELHSDDDL